MLTFRDQVLAPLAWVGAGTCWATQVLVPWTSSGLLSSSTQVDGIRLIHGGVVTAVAPAWSAYLLLVLPVSGIGLVGLASLDGGTTQRLRLTLAGLGTLGLGLALHVFASFDPRRLGPGGLVAVAGLVLALVAAGLDRSSRSATSPSHRPREVV